jgi:pimeloyl-ACP methyl ester carboxylesterase
VLRRRPPCPWHARDPDRQPLKVDSAGDPQGTPVVYLHGGGDSRLSRHPDDSIAASLGVRLLAVDRCGPADRHRTLRSWAADLVAIAGEHGVGEFGVVGWSAGGPHALAVAAVAPERVRRVALVASLPLPDGTRMLPADVRRAMRVARYAPRHVARRLEAWGREPPAPTGDALTDEAYRAGRRESFAAGGLWLAHELAYLGRPWGFELADVRAPVTVWWGERDTVTPVSIARDFAAGLPDATLRLVDDSHQLLFSRWRDILSDAARPRLQSPP